MVLNRCCGRKPSSANSARVFRCLFNLGILYQAIGLDRAFHYFDKEILGKSNTSYSRTWKKETNNFNKGVQEEKYLAIKKLIKEEMEQLGIELLNP